MFISICIAGECLGGKLNAGIFDDCSEPTEVLKGFLFWATAASVITVASHQTFLVIASKSMLFMDKVPDECRFPHLEIKVFMALTTGMIDSGLSVLASSETAVGWKIIAAILVSLALFFVLYFLRKGKDFQQCNHWLPIASVRALFREVDKEAFEGAVFYSKLEVVRAAQEAGISKKMGASMFEKFDVGINGVISYDDFTAMFEHNRISMKVAFQSCSWVEGLFAMIIEPNYETGKYFSNDVGDITSHFGGHFSKFTPRHTLYYFLSICRFFVVVAVLNFLAHFPWVQALAATIVEGTWFGLVVKDAPYVFIDMSRAELISGCGRTLTFLFALFPFMGLMSAEESSAAIVQVAFLMILHIIFTLLFPVVWPLIRVLFITPTTLVVKILFPGQIFPGQFCAGDEVYSLVSRFGGEHFVPRGSKGTVQGPVPKKHRISFPDWKDRVAVEFEGCVVLYLLAVVKGSQEANDSSDCSEDLGADDVDSDVELSVLAARAAAHPVQHSQKHRQPAQGTSFLSSFSRGKIELSRKPPPQGDEEEPKDNPLHRPGKQSTTSQPQYTESPVKSGFLMKGPKKENGTWRNRYFVLNRHSLCFFKTVNSITAAGDGSQGELLLTGVNERGLILTSSSSFSTPFSLPTS